MERTVTSLDEDASHYFDRVVVRTFDDLQALGFAPEELREEPVRKAIADDDLEALRGAHVSCEGHQSTHESS